MKSKQAKVVLAIRPFKIPAKLALQDACGGWSRSFKASIQLTVRDLDEHGFVVENLSLIAEVKKRFSGHKYKASFEQLALGIISVAHEMVGDRLLSASVEVFNLTGHLESCWKRGDAVPTFPKEA